MALPPEPLPELLDQADTVVIAEVVEVLSQGAPPPPPVHPDAGKATFKGAGFTEASQRVKLRVERTLKGKAAAEVVVDKPEAPYLLAPGARGPFFLRAGVIVGRYGPDTHPRDEVEAALGK